MFVGVLFLFLPQASDPVDIPTRNVIELAQRAGMLIGHARNCGLDPVEIEEFYVAAQARINALSNNSNDRVMARIQLSNTASIQEANGPKEGCVAFQERFKTRFRMLR